MLNIDAAHIPWLAALATLCAAVVGGLVAITVAFVNAWAQRRIAIDVAHRDHRLAVATEYMRDARQLIDRVYEMYRVRFEDPPSRWHQLVREIVGTEPWSPEHRRVPDDPVFADALRIHRLRAAHLEIWLQISTAPYARDPEKVPAGIHEVALYMGEITDILEIAAEAYVFRIGRLRRNAKKMLAGLGEKPLKTRIDEGRNAFDRAFAVPIESGEPEVEGHELDDDLPI